jgi:DNA-binding IclR family transcriptional regulator
MIDEYLLSAPFKQYTSKTISDAVSLQRELNKIRKKGYAENFGGRISEASGCATPIFSISGTIVAAINAAGPTSQYQKNRNKIIDALVDCAKEISRFLTAVEGQSSSNASIVS